MHFQTLRRIIVLTLLFSHAYADDGPKAGTENPRTSPVQETFTRVGVGAILPDLEIGGHAAIFLNETNSSNYGSLRFSIPVNEVGRLTMKDLLHDFYAGIGHYWTFSPNPAAFEDGVGYTQAGGGFEAFLSHWGDETITNSVKGLLATIAVTMQEQQGNKNTLFSQLTVGGGIGVTGSESADEIIENSLVPLFCARLSYYAPIGEAELYWRTGAKNGEGGTMEYGFEISKEYLDHLGLSVGYKRFEILGETTTTTQTTGHTTTTITETQTNDLKKFYVRIEYRF